MRHERFGGKLARAALIGVIGFGVPVVATASSAPHVEQPDDPPAVNDPRSDPTKRSSAPQLVPNPYRIAQVNVDSLGQNIVDDAANEPSITINPTDPDNMVIGWRQFDDVTSNFRQAGWAYTFDGGLTWTFPGTIEPGVFRSDPVLDADSQGNLYYQSLRSNLSLQVFKSTDGGVSWLPGVESFGGDKNWMAIDRTGGPGAGNVYGIWQRFAACCGSDVFTRSVDGAASFETPVSVTNSPTFGTLAVGPDGEVYAAGISGVSGQNFNTFVVSWSTDAQLASSTPTFAGTQVVLGGAMESSTGPNPGGLLGQANVAVDRSDGPTRGNVYLLASVRPVPGPDPLDVYIARSVDGGTTWSAPVRVNDDAPAEDHWQWFAAHSVAPDGRIDVVWYDTRGLGVDNVSQLYYAYSYDAGESWSDNAWISRAFDSHVGWPNQNKIGDYITIVSDATGGHVAFAATFNGEQDVYYANVFPDCNGNQISDVIDLADDVSFDCDASRIPDECESAPVCIGAGSVPDGRLVPGTQLTLAKAAGGEIELAWGDSCVGEDADYAIYEGAIGDFASHGWRFCTTEGQTDKGFLPQGGDRYYLVVPVHADREGSYGTDGSDDERPQGAPSCHPQLVRSCD